MKRALCLILCLGLVLTGCSFSGQRLREPVTFYYVRQDYRYGTEDGVIAGESRESAGHGEDLNYLLSMYLMGPTSEELESPLPEDTVLLGVIQLDGAVTLQLSDTEKTLTDLEFSLACACLATTVMGIASVTQVTVESGDRANTVTRENLTIYDSSTAATTEAIQ